MFALVARVIISMLFYDTSLKTLLSHVSGHSLFFLGVYTRQTNYMGIMLVVLSMY